MSSIVTVEALFTRSREVASGMTISTVGTFDVGVGVCCESILVHR